MKHCGVEGDRIVVIRDVNEGRAADHDMEADQQCQSETLSKLPLAVSHLFAFQGGISSLPTGYLNSWNGYNLQTGKRPSNALIYVRFY